MTLLELSDGVPIIAVNALSNGRLESPPHFVTHRLADMVESYGRASLREDSGSPAVECALLNHESTPMDTNSQIRAAHAESTPHQMT